MQKKPYLALISPFPPQKTGVADYMAQLLPALEHYYELVLVTEDQKTRNLAHHFPGEITTASDFLGRHELHQRVVYQLGNSPAHLYAFDLLKTIPGCVVLHDFFLGNALAHAQLYQNKEDALLLPLLQSHGLSLLPDFKKNGIQYCVNHYPANLPFLKNALAIGVHSKYIQELAHTYYGHCFDHLFRPIPFPKELRPINTKAHRQKNLDKLNFPSDAFIVSTFGFGSPAKQHELILQAWLNCDLVKASSTFLVFVGEYFNAEYLSQLHYRIPTHLNERIRFTGFVSQEIYEQYLSITDLSIQLRDQSRGENSASIMDCLSAGIAVIANDHGAITDLPRNVLWKISHPASLATLINSLEHLHESSSTRFQLAQDAKKYLETIHPLNETGKAYYEMIEGSLDEAKLGHTKPIKIESVKTGLKKVQLLLDITDTANHDKRTGIQRVVRGLLQALLCLSQNEHDYLIRPIYLDEFGIYRYANQYTLGHFGAICPGFLDEPVQVQSQDIYLDLDFNTITAVEQENTYDQWRNQGVYVIHLVFDLLPLEHPEWFLPFMRELFGKWLKSVSTHSDALFTISKTVAKDLEYFLKNPNNSITGLRPKIEYFTLGSDILATLPSQSMPADSPELIERLHLNPTLLMVSTLEPRKAYEQSLDALEELWKRGHKINLVIVGKVGWLAESLTARILGHSQLGHQLFWLSEISDRYLESLYQRSTALLMASYGEGFGLPIIEAAHYKLPIIARKIPVFEEVGGEHISYFEAHNGIELANHISDWLELSPKLRPDISRWEPHGWDKSAKQILKLINSTRTRN